MSTWTQKLDVATRADLARHFANLGYRRGAEIGVWAGEFSETLCRTIPHLELYGVDPWEAYDDYQEKKNNQARLDAAYEQARARLAPFNARLFRMTSLKAAALVPDGSLDFVYLDGNHALAFVRADLEAWVPKVRAGGIVSGHDYELRKKKSPWIDVQEAVDAYTQAHQIDPWYVLAGDKSPSWFWVVK